MIYNISLLLQKIRVTGLSALSPAKASAVGGLLSELCTFDDEATSLLASVQETAISCFSEAATPGLQSQWLLALIHICHGDRDNLFADVYDEDEFQALDALQQEVESRWTAEISGLTAEESRPFDGLPLSERLHRLLLFFHHDINALSGGDDQRASSLVARAEALFEECRTELFDSQTSDLTSFVTYYHVLAAIRPDHKSPGSVRYYKQYFLASDNYFLDLADGSDLWWAACEIRFHHQSALESHFDLSALAGLWLARPESLAAFRRQIYLWLLELDPYEACDLQERALRLSYADTGFSRIASWLRAKQAAGIPIPLEQEADVLLTIVLAENINSLSTELGSYRSRRVWTVLQALPFSKLRTHLLALASSLYMDDNRLSEAQSEIRTWLPSAQTQEDQFLTEFLDTSPVLSMDSVYP